MKFDFYTALVVIAGSSANAISIVKNDALQHDSGLSKREGESALAAQSGTDADSEFFDSHYYTVSGNPNQMPTQ